jgi:hypothetical protein
MSDHTVTLNVERVTVAGFAGGAAAVQPTGSRAVPSGQSKEGRMSSVRLVYNEELGRPVVQILDRETGEVIYQIPPEELQKLSTFIEGLRGSVLDELA